MRRQITELSDLKGTKKMNALSISNRKIFALLSKNFSNLGFLLLLLLLQLLAFVAIAIAFLSSLQILFSKIAIFQVKKKVAAFAASAILPARNRRADSCVTYN